MNEYYIVSFEQKTTSFSFYNKILPQLHTYFLYHRDERLLIDLSEVEFINPLAIPNILVVGSILKNYFKKPCEMYIPWNPRLLSYLSDINFLNLVRSHELFTLDEKFIGGYTSHNINPECNTYIFLNGVSKDEIRTDLKRSETIIEFLSETHNSDVTENVLRLMTEICHNACNHSGSNCFATFQSNLGRNVKYKKAFIAISDFGEGFYNSLTSKSSTEYQSLFIKRLNGSTVSEYSNILAILDAIYFRKDYTEYGIYQVISNVLAKNGLVRIHSEDTQLVITANNFKRFIADWNVLLRELSKASYSELDIQFSPIRKTETKLKGVHIEFELPIT